MYARILCTCTRDVYSVYMCIRYCICTYRARELNEMLGMDACRKEILVNVSSCRRCNPWRQTFLPPFHDVSHYPLAFSLLYTGMFATSLFLSFSLKTIRSHISGKRVPFCRDMKCMKIVSRSENQRSIRENAE